MKCPSCEAILSGPVEECPECGLCVDSLDSIFGPVPRHFSLLTDLARLFSRAETEKLRRFLALLHAKFPQVRFSIFTCDLPNRPAQEYGFWLFNRCRFTESGLRGAKNLSLLLLINIGTDEASLSCGYGLEALVAEERFKESLDAASPGWESANWFQGVQLCFRAVVKHLVAATVEKPAGDAEIEKALSDLTTKQEAGA